MTAHVYAFSRDWRAGKRLCGECHLTYDEGEHLHVAVLKPFTSYVCPNGSGRGHSSMWSGAQNVPELRRPNDDRCVCGAQFVEEDAEVWRISFEVLSPYSGDWAPVERLGTKRSTHEQRDGLLTMPDEVRNVQLARVDA